MTNSAEKPLITFALFAYNQERFIREAVEGAFSQSYSPLEIILSDDCSPDRTFDIMKEMAAEYTGPHTIVLNRNEGNLGVSGHVNRVMEIARGELIVVAAGDDISLSLRTERIYEEYQKKPDALSFFSLTETIDINGNYIGLHCPDNHVIGKDLFESITHFCCCVIGASHAWHRSIFDFYGPLYDKTIYEDRSISLRAKLLGSICFIPEVLVRYRIHENNLSKPQLNRNNRDSRIYYISAYDRTLNLIDSFIHDLNKYNSLFPNRAKDIKKASEYLFKKKAEFNLKRKLVSTSEKFYQLKSFFKLFKYRLKYKEYFKYFLFILFPVKYDNLRYLFNKSKLSQNTIKIK